MDFPNCFQKGHMHLGYDDSNNVALFRCCTRNNEILDRVTIEEFLKKDVFQWCKENFLKNPTPHEKYCWIEKAECDYTKDPKLLSVEVGLSQACNLNCPFCFMKGRHRDEPRMKEVYFWALNSLKGKGLECIKLTDFGEPFFYKKETFEFLKSLTSEDFNLISITTNATLLNEEDIKTLSNLKIPIRVAVSLDSLVNEHHKQIRGDNFNKVIENIFSLKKYGLLEHINSTRIECNKDDIEQIQEFCKFLGITHTYSSLI